MNLRKPTDLGIDSLTAVEVQIWVKSDLQVEVDVEQLFTTPSIRDLAITIDQLLKGDPGCVELGIAFALKSRSLGDLPSPESKGNASALLFSIRWRRGIRI
jgi:hypothetical protein